MADEADLARLGVIVDASGARREIQLTREELINLANGAPLAEKALAGVTQSFRAMHTAGMTWTAFLKANMAPAMAQFGGHTGAMKELGAQWKALTSGMAAAAPPAVQGINRVTEAMQRMRVAARQAQAAAQASQITLVDPFQKTAVVATKAAFNVNGLRQAMTTLAVASGALPGALGRIGSSIGAFAIGGGIMVGALAGIAALGFAWEKLTAKTRKAREELDEALGRLRELKREQGLGPGGQVGADVAAVQAELARRRAELQEINRLIRLGPQFTGAGGGVTAGTSALEERRRRLIQEYVDIAGLAAAGETKVTAIITEAIEDQDAKEEAAFRRRMERMREEYNERIALEQAMAQAMARHLAAIDDAMQPQRNAARIPAPGGDFQIDPGVMRGIEKMLDDMSKAEAAQKRADALRIGAFAGVASGIASQMGGPFGSAASGLIAGIGGGAPGMAVGALAGLTSGLLSMADSAQQAREAVRQLKIANEAYMDSVLHELGLLSDADAAERATRREIEARQRAQIPFEFDPNSQRQRQQLEQMFGKQGAQDRIDEWLRLNGVMDDLIRKRREEADAIERLSTAMRNSPTGFFVEAYFSAHAARGGESRGGATPTSAGGGRGRGTTVVIQQATFPLPAGSSAEQVRAFVRELDQYAASIGGAGTSRAAALDMIS